MASNASTSLPLSLNSKQSDAIILVFFLVVFLVCSLLVSNRRLKLPAPEGASWLWGHEKEVFMSEPGVAYKKWINALGHAYRIKAALWMPDIVVLADPAGISYLLQKKVYDYHHSHVVRPRVERLMGRGLGWVEGETSHKRMRRMISPSLSSDNLRHMSQMRLMEAASQVLNDFTNVIQESKSGGSRVNILYWTNKAALNVIGRVAFQHDFDGGNSDHAQKILQGRHSGSSQITKYAGFLTLMLLRRFTVLNKLPITVIQAQGHAKQAIQSGVAAEIVRYEQGDITDTQKHDRKDLLNRLLTAFSKEELSKEELYAQISTMVVGGLESTALSLGFAINELARHPETQKRLREELEVFNGEPTYDEFMTSFPYLDAVFKETVRLYPGLAYMERVATKDDVLPLHYPVRMSDGQEYRHLSIRTGQTVVIPIFAIHHLDSLWGDAENFDPDRWLRPLPDDVKRFSGWSHLLGFSDGPRSCIGMRLAIIEFKVILFGLIRRFRFEPVDQEITLKIASSLQPWVKGKEQEGPQLPVSVHLL